MADLDKTPSLYIKRGDLEPEFECVIESALGPYNGSGAAKVTVFMQLDDETEPAIELEAECDSEGKVTHAWVAGETDVAGLYKCETEVQPTNGRPISFPKKGYEYIEITVDLGTA